MSYYGGAARRWERTQARKGRAEDVAAATLAERQACVAYIEQVAERTPAPQHRLALRLIADELDRGCHHDDD